MLLCYIVEWDPTLRSYYGKVAPQGGMPLHYIEEWDSTLRSYLERAESSSVRWNATPYLIFHINLDKHTTWIFENNNLLVRFFLGEIFLCVILTQKIVNTFYDTI